MPKNATFFAYLPPPGDPLTCTFCGELPETLVVAERMQGEPVLICSRCVRQAEWAIEDHLRTAYPETAAAV